MPSGSALPWRLRSWRRQKKGSSVCLPPIGPGRGCGFRIVKERVKCRLRGSGQGQRWRAGLCAAPLSACRAAEKARAVDGCATLRPRALSGASADLPAQSAAVAVLLTNCQPLSGDAHRIPLSHRLSARERGLARLFCLPGIVLGFQQRRVSLRLLGNTALAQEALQAPSLPPA